MSEPGKMNLKSMNITEEQKAKLRELFPEVFTEGKVDFDKLRLTLGDEVDDGTERYGMNWHGKRDCFKVIQQPSAGTLKPCRDESVNFDDTENLFIEGDNLEVLKLLQKSYYGKVKMIYIDPPYNTGKEFIYPDNYKENLDTYLAYTGQVDDEGRKFSTNAECEGRFHSNWLNMMYPRLFLARNLLREDGVIFISIDDNEMTNLKKLCDDIFGEECFVESFVWKKSYGGGPKEKYAVTQHEYVLLYVKQIEQLPEFNLKYDPDKVERYYKHEDKNVKVRGPYRLKPLEATKSMDARPNLVYGIPAPDGTDVFPKRQWLWGKERVLKALDQGELEFISSSFGVTYNYKQYLRDENGVERGEKPFSVIDGIYTQRGTDDLRKLFDDKVVVQFPKPVDLIKKFIEIGSVNDTDSIVLDFFAGSATTADSVINLNAENHLKNKFIMVQLPELCDQVSDAYMMGYKTIADIGKDRIRRVIRKIADERKPGEGELPGMEVENAELDLGFRVFKLDRSNFKLWDGEVGEAPTEAQLVEQLELGIDHINPASTPEDILYELLLKSGFELTTKVESLELAGKTVYSVEKGALLICLEDNLTKDVITGMARLQPARVVCLDHGFAGNDQLKTNAVQIMKSHEVGDFRTV